MVDKHDIDQIRVYLVENVFRNSNIVFNDEIRNGAGSDIDLLSLIASLYNELYKYVTGECYDYFFHWANKVGGWVEDDYISELLKGD